jgi:hypothetical protein
MFTVKRSGKVIPVGSLTVFKKIPINFRDRRIILDVNSTLYAREYPDDEKADGYFVVDMSKPTFSGLVPIVSIDNDPVIMTSGTYASMAYFITNLHVVRPTV